MKLKPPLHVWGELDYACFRYAQERLQAEADSHLAGGGLPADSLRRLAPARIYLQCLRRRNGFWFFAVHIHWNDGLCSRRHVRVSHKRQHFRAGSLWVNLQRQVHLEWCCPVCTLKGARAGSGTPMGAAGQRRSRSRPEIGWARARRRA